MKTRCHVCRKYFDKSSRQIQCPDCYDDEGRPSPFNDDFPDMRPDGYGIEIHYGKSDGVSSAERY